MRSVDRRNIAPRIRFRGFRAMDENAMLRRPGPGVVWVIDGEIQSREFLA
jgi:hypothetical protein